MARVITTSVHEIDTAVGRARLHVRSVVRPRAVVVLGHGAGRGSDTEDLLGLAGSLPGHGVCVVLVDQPWVLAGRAVASAPATLDVAWTSVLADLRQVTGAAPAVPIVAGGRSAGARVAARTAESTGASAVLLLAFPLLPPSARTDPARRAAALGIRAAEIRRPLEAGIPVVAVQGGRDVFGGPKDLASALGPEQGGGLDVVEVIDADHALRTRRGGPDPAPVLLAAALRAVALARGE